MGRRHYNYLFSLGIVFLTGCASLQGSIETLEKKVSRQGKDLQQIRQKQAELDTQMDSMQSELQSSKGSVEESTHYVQKASDDLMTLGEQFKKQEAELAMLQEDIRTIKALLGIKVVPQADTVSSLPKEKLDETAPAIPPASNLAKVTGVPDPEELYNNAYSKLSKGDFSGARTGFKEFLQLFPQTEYSDNAQFWIGECYYREKRYEEAILEFEEVIKKFPQGNKVPDALLKQAFSFIALNDTNSAKLLLRKVMDRYPTSEQAEIAKAKLGSL